MGNSGLPLASLGHGCPDSVSPQLSSSDMSLQSGRRSQRYSRGTHSLWLWQANSVSVQTLGTWGTVEVRGVRGSSRRRGGRAGLNREWASCGRHSKYKRPLASASVAHTGYEAHGNSLASLIWMHVQWTCHTHAATMPHTCKPQPGPVRRKGVRRQPVGHA